MRRCIDNTTAGLTRGYTLIELLIVVAILGLAAAMVIPQFSGTDSMRVQAAVRLVIADLSFAQTDAMAHQEYRKVHFFADGTGYCILKVDESGTNGYSQDYDPDTAQYVYDPLGSAAESSQYIVDFTEDDRFENISISDVDLDGGETFLTYDTIGGTVMTGDGPGTGGTITVSSDDEDYIITIEPFTGKLRVSGP